MGKKQVTSDVEQGAPTREEPGHSPSAGSSGVQEAQPGSTSSPVKPGAVHRVTTQIKTRHGLAEIHHATEYAPNIVLNYDAPGRGRRRYLPGYALFGAMLQLGVLVMGGLTTYNPTFELREHNSPISPFAFHLTTIGTILVVVGMMICSKIIEWSTAEVTWDSAGGEEFYLLWVQNGQVVNDQQFGSYAIFAKDKRSSFKTSFPSHLAYEKKPNPPPVQTGPVPKNALHTTPKAGNIQTSTAPVDTQYKTLEDGGIHMSTTPVATLHKTPEASGMQMGTSTTTGDNIEPDHDSPTPPQWLAVVCTGISISGFILQFIGLRGMHWSATVAQLGATLIMTVVRALVRLDATTKARAQLLPRGSELEMLALQLASVSITEPNNQAKPPASNSASKTGPREPERLWKPEYDKPTDYQGTPDGRRGDTDSDGPRCNNQFQWELCIDWEMQDHRPADTQNQCIEFHKAAVPGQANTSNVLEVRKRLATLTKRKSLATKDAAALRNSLEVVMNGLFGPAGKANVAVWPVPVKADGFEHNVYVNITRKDQKWQADEDEVEALLALVEFKYNLGRVGEKKGKRVLVLGPKSMTPSLYMDCSWWAYETLDSVKVLRQMQLQKKREPQARVQAREPPQTKESAGGMGKDAVTVKNLVGYFSGECQSGLLHYVVWIPVGAN